MRNITESSAKKRVLVVGAGPAALEVVLGLVGLAWGRAEVELVAPESAFSYRPQAVAHLFGAAAPFRLELARFADDTGARLHYGRVVAVDESNRTVVTAAGERLAYDLLVVACGARLEESLSGALSFRGEPDDDALRAVVAGLQAGRLSSIAFVAPPGASWPLPLYELALMTAAQLRPSGRAGARLSLVTAEARPLEHLGEVASDTVARLLDTARVDVRCASRAIELAHGELRLEPAGSVPAERAVALPRLRGPQLAGLPADGEGFLSTDEHGLVWGTEDVYAAGDATTFPVKHGGIAVQQAGAVAEALAARLGVGIRPAPFRPVLRGLLLTGDAPLFLSSDLTGERGKPPAVSPQALWWPPGKIAGGRLAAYLRDQGLAVPPPPAGPATVPVELELPLPGAR